MIPRPNPTLASLTALVLLTSAAAMLVPLGGCGGGPQGDPRRGAMVYETCASCHALNPQPDEIYFGPHLQGIIGREVAADPEFDYSDAMLEYGGVWTEERLAAYLRAPEEAIPGTDMVQALPRPQDVADVIAYLKSVQDDSQRER
jgi:cytochrome c